MQKYRPFLIIALVLAIAIIGAMLLLRSSWKQSLDVPTPTPQAVSKTQAIPAQVVVTLEEFGDYQCPPCGELHPTLKQLKQESGPNLNFVFRNLPLTTIHKNSLVAAQAAEAARMQNRFWEMHDLLYREQAVWAKTQDVQSLFNSYAGMIGLDLERFKKDVGGEEVKAKVESDRKRGEALGVKNTPTIFLNNQSLPPTSLNPTALRAAVDAAVKEKTKVLK